MKRSAFVLMLFSAALLLANSCGGGGGGGSTAPASTTYTVGGTVTGLSGTVVLQLNGGDDLAVTSSGAFAFSTELADGAAYTVTVKTHPAGRYGYVTNGTGTISGAGVTGVRVNCQLDAAFSTDGVAVYAGPAGSGDYGHAVAVDSLGRVLVAGETSNGTDSDMAIWPVQTSW